MRRRTNAHNCYEDYAHELDDEAARRAHENYECEEGCQFCEAEREAPDHDDRD